MQHVLVVSPRSARRVPHNGTVFPTIEMDIAAQMAKPLPSKCGDVPCVVIELIERRESA